MSDDRGQKARGILLGAIVAALGAGLVGTVGCSRRAAPAPRPAEPQVITASALLYSPPLALETVDRAGLNAILAREGRGEAAFFGYAEPFVESYFLRVDDRQQQFGFSGGAFGRGVGFRHDVYSRRAVSTRTGVLVR